MIQRKSLFLSLLLAISALLPAVCLAQPLHITNDPQHKTLQFGNDKMILALDYSGKANISLLTIRGQHVIDGPAGIYSEIRTKNAIYSTLHLSADPDVKITHDIITVTGIVYGDKDLTIRETWKFTISADHISFDLTRSLSKQTIVEQAALPVFLFNSIDTWEGAYQDYGGLAWFYLFNKRADTYGVHARSSEFWNSKTGNGLKVAVEAPGKEIAMVYSRTATDQLSYSIQASKNEMTPRFDSGTQRRRYIRDRTDVWAPYTSSPGIASQRIILTAFDARDRYDRGNMAGINGGEVSAVLNTIARIGVIDRRHFGGNSWHTPYGPICLHEQYIAQMGLAINDTNYLKGYKECLDYYRDNAIKPDGRVWPRWAYSNEDMMAGEVTDKGFYEAQWGYLLDANPDLVTNVAELYDLTGDKAWVKTHQGSCEKALDWILQRDSNNNGLVEMITDSHTQKKGSDWIDIIWASYENAFVNAKLYRALVLWTDIEKQLGNPQKEKYYRQFAEKLKNQFNRSVAEGGFWDDEKKCYIHWRDKDGSIHGTNMVTPVNFMAVGYGICDNVERRNTILDNIETQMEKEKLFFWPICLYTYQPGEGNDWQFPFPNYENGDIFLSWGALGVKAYASYKPELAVKYVQNVLQQYAKDGLAFQRYGRAKQDGRGDDILSGNSLSVIGLYQAVYGLNPLYNRLYLNPHMTEPLNGTSLKYHFRGQQWTIDLSVDHYGVSNGRLAILSKKDFGFYGSGSQLSFFNGSRSDASLKVITTANSSLTLDIKSWDGDRRAWTQSSKDRQAGKLVYIVQDLTPNGYYTVMVNNKSLLRSRANAAGSLQFEYRTGADPDHILILNK